MSKMWVDFEIWVQDGREGLSTLGKGAVSPRPRLVLTD